MATHDTKTPEVVADDKVIVLDNEFDQIRQCLGMYIGIGEAEGVMHLVNEVTTNCIDEGVNPVAIKAGIGDVIKFYFDEKECRFTIIDNGRGMPLDKMMDLVGRKHAGTKFRNITSANRYSGGQNGVGVTVTAALSSSFSVQCWQNGKTRKLHMDGNVLVDDGYEDCDYDKHGTCISFVPAKKWIGEFKIELPIVEDYLRRLSYILPDRIKVKYFGKPKKGKDVSITYKAQGIWSNVEYLGQELMFPPIYLKVPEVVIDYPDQPDREPDFFKMEFAFSYDKTIDQPIMASFCNYVATKDGGYHESVVQKAIADFFTKQAKELDPNHKYEVTQDDVRSGLIAVVNLDHSNPNFEGQHKSRVGQRDLPKYARKPILEQLEKFFESNNGLLRKICGYLHQVAKARLEVNKVKKKVLQKATSFLDDAEMKIFANISDRNYTGYKELILAEGDSAIAAIGGARNVKCQALLAITGVVPNTLNMSVAQIMKSPTFATLVKVLGCGIGETFDISRLKWDAIIIATDGDIDGIFIQSLLCVFFMVHMPQIITSGRLYRVLPPLYLVDRKKTKQATKDYLFDKLEYYHLFHQIICDNLRFSIVTPHTLKEFVKGAGEIQELKGKEKMDLLNLNMAYFDELDNLSRRSACIMEVLEYVVYFLLVSGRTNDAHENFEKLIKSKFPELDYNPETHALHGSYNRKNITLIVDDIFLNMAERMMRLMIQNPAFYLLVKAKNSSRGDAPEDQWDLMSYGAFMKMCNEAYQVALLQRYKGLGEMETMMVFQSMMNPKTRKLLRITMDNPEEAKRIMAVLHDDTNAARETRRKMLAEADITQADIDN